jgi:hypothetical protein
MAIDTRSISNLMHVDMQENSIQAQKNERKKKKKEYLPCAHHHPYQKSLFDTIDV